MNNFVFSGQDPLLFQSYQGNRSSHDDLESKQNRLNEMMVQYKQMQQQVPTVVEKDYLSDLDTMMKSLRGDIAEKLIEDEEYVRLNEELQGIIQSEIMSMIKWKVNANPTAIHNMEKQKELINKVKVKHEEEERKNLNELNDYMKNYSSMTFDEYKKLKSEKV